jgi:hypothetical protein
MPSTPDALLDRAIQETGLSDFGPDGWQDAYADLVGSIAVDLGDDPDAVALIEAIVVNRLVRRLQVEQWYAGHGAEAAAHPVEGPLMIVGTARSGPTACHHLLSLDPQFRTLRKWEIDDPVPPPVLETEHLDPRRPKEVVAGVQHIATVDGPTEDRKILELMFHDDALPLALRSHLQWWLHADHTVAFPYHERILRLLHSHRPPYRWLLKSPDFIHYIEPAVAQYPDMKFVMTHRDPLKVVPSACSVTVAGTRQRIPDWQYPDTFGRDMLENLATGTRRVIASRAALGEERFLDVGQPELNADPVGVAERIYEFAGLELHPDVRAEMARWGEENRAGARGEHRYSPEEFGLTDDMIRTEFAEYLDHYARWCAPVRGGGHGGHGTRGAQTTSA